MKYVILIHANPNPWGHPTGHFTDEGRQLDAFQRLAMDRKFDELMEGMAASGELVVCEALADPGSSTIYRWEGDTHVATDGPYAETKEHLAGFWIIDVADLDAALEWAKLATVACRRPVEVVPFEMRDINELLAASAAGEL